MSETELGRLTDVLNGKIQDFELALEGLKLGVKAGVKFMDHDDVLEFTNGGTGRFKLMVRKGQDLVPLKSCSRETRLMAVHLFKPLLSALLKATDDEHDRILKAIKVVEGAIEDVRTSGVCHE